MMSGMPTRNLPWLAFRYSLVVSTVHCQYSLSASNFRSTLAGSLKQGLYQTVSWAKPGCEPRNRFRLPGPSEGVRYGKAMPPWKVRATADSKRARLLRASSQKSRGLAGGGGHGSGFSRGACTNTAGRLGFSRRHQAAYTSRISSQSSS